MIYGMATLLEGFGLQLCRGYRKTNDRPPEEISQVTSSVVLGKQGIAVRTSLRILDVQDQKGCEGGP
jgi:hypothetical protein